jgi:hypothetical protein
MEGLDQLRLYRQYEIALEKDRKRVSLQRHQIRRGPLPQQFAVQTFISNAQGNYISALVLVHQDTREDQLVCGR